MTKSYGWLMVAMVFIAGCVSFLDRAALSVVAPLIVKDLHLDPSTLGAVFSTFFVGYSALCFLGGIASDRFGPRRVLLVAMVFWSLFCGLTAVATTFGTLLMVRVLFGMAEGPFLASASKLLGNWFSAPKRATAISIAHSGTTLGGAIAGPMVTYIAVSYGWRTAFVAIAAIGLVWAAAWALVGKDGEPSPPNPRGPIGAYGTEGKAFTQPLGAYLRHPSVLAIAFAFFGFGYLLYFFLSWFPSYLTMERHLSIKDMSVISTIPWLMGFVGYIAGGVVSDRICTLTGRPIYARRIVLVSSLLGAAVCVVFAGYADSVLFAAALMGTSILFLYASANCYWALVLDMIEASRVGAVGGFVHMVGNFAGVLAPFVTGLLVQRTGSFSAAFGLAGSIALLGSLCIAFLIPSDPSGLQMPVCDGCKPV